jgi:hypothetical protein
VQINVADINVIGESDAQIFSLVGQSTTDVQLFLSNLGDNTINYHFQQNVSGTWTDISGVSGADPDNDNQILTGTLTSGQTRSVHIKVTNPQIRLMANASGGSSIWFQVSRFVVRGDGGALPILNL